MKIKKAPNPIFNACKELIGLYLKKGDKINWPREIKIAKKLLSQYPIEFWRQYDPYTTFTSLAVFLTNSGKKEIEKQFGSWNLTKPKDSVKLEDKPVVQISPVEVRKPNTLQNFIDA